LDAEAQESHAGHRIVQWVLRVGLAIAAALMVAGLAIALATDQHAAAAVSLSDLFGPHTLADRLIAFGLALLASTPLVRVLALVAIWVYERDRRFALLGLVVVAILTASIASGHG
jgi:uncharacterized membrane protein